MSLPVAFQSFVFYMLACTPCAKVRHRHKAKQKAKKEREEKARMEAERPDVYRHPDPFNTNQYWAEEIMMGPSLPKKGRKSEPGSKNPSQRGLNSAGLDTSTASSGAVSNLGTATGDAPNPRSPSCPSIAPLKSPPEASPTVVPEEDDAVSATVSHTLSGSTADDWNRKRYQREDEELWGHENHAWTGHKLMDAIKQAGSSAGRYVEARLGRERQVTDEARNSFYYPPRNPPVNDYHPPVVSSRPVHKDAHKWMLQPPPPAKVMEGKIPVSRSGSVMSQRSRRTTVGTISDSGGLGRMLGEKAAEAKMRQGEALTSGEASLGQQSVSTSRTRSHRKRSQGATGDLSMSGSTGSEGDADADEARSRGPRRPRRRHLAATAPAATTVADTLDDQEDEAISKSLADLSNTIVPEYAPRKLPTILGTGHESDENASPSNRKSETTDAARVVVSRMSRLSA